MASGSQEMLTNAGYPSLASTFVSFIRGCCLWHAFYFFPRETLKQVELNRGNAKKDEYRTQATLSWCPHCAGYC